MSKNSQPAQIVMSKKHSHKIDLAAAHAASERVFGRKPAFGLTLKRWSTRL